MSIGVVAKLRESWPAALPASPVKTVKRGPPGCFARAATSSRMRRAVTSLAALVPVISGHGSSDLSGVWQSDFPNAAKASSPG
jgi:hypothetical protein